MNSTSREGHTVGQSGFEARQIPLHLEDYYIPARTWLGRTYICGSRSAIWIEVGPKDYHSCGRHDCTAHRVGVQEQLYYSMIPSSLVFQPRHQHQSCYIQSAVVMLEHLGFPVAGEKI